MKASDAILVQLSYHGHRNLDTKIFDKLIIILEQTLESNISG
jgi:hypothetical protein